MINIAIVGLGNIAPRVAQGVSFTKDACLYAVASTSKEKALDFKEKYNAQVAYDNYEDVYKDTNIDLVYLCTPNHLHYDQIISCFNYNKHVICEKPMVATTQEVKELFEIARSKNLFLMEAQKTVFTNLHSEIQKIINNNEIGEVISIRADYCYNLEYQSFKEDHWVFNEKSGGCLKDVGVYPICFANSISNSSVKSVTGKKFTNNNYKCDFGGVGIIEYQNGIKATIECSWFYDSIDRGYAIIFGTKGKIEVPTYWKGNKCKVIYDDGNIKEVSVYQDSDFTNEIQEAINCIVNNQIQSKKMNEEKIIEIMKVIKVISES